VRRHGERKICSSVVQVKAYFQRQANLSRAKQVHTCRIEVVEKAQEEKIGGELVMALFSTLFLTSTAPRRYAITTAGFKRKRKRAIRRRMKKQSMGLF